MRSLKQISAALDRRLADEKAALVNHATSSSAPQDTEESVRKRRQSKAFEDLAETALALSDDVAFALSMQIDELVTHKAEFRQGMQRAFMRVLQTASQNHKKVVVFNEAVPGFTLMLFKKAPQAFENQPVWDVEHDVGFEESPEARATSVLAQTFFKRTNHRVLSIETQDALFAFFPVTDLRKNLKDMGFYMVD